MNHFPPHCRGFGLEDTHPQFALIIESVQQFDDVLMIAGGQDVDLHHVVLQLFLSLRINDFGGGKDARLPVLSLEVKQQNTEYRVLAGMFHFFFTPASARLE